MRTRVMSVAFAALVAGALCAGCRSASAPPEGLADVTFVALDIETTGFSSRNDRIVEIGAVKFGNGRELGRFERLVDPGCAVPAAAEKVHGISTAMVRNSGVPFEDAFPDFREFCGDAVLLAHNASFDTRFMGAEIARAGMSSSTNGVIDTLSLFRGWFPELDGHGLADMRVALKVPEEATHRALADAVCLRKVFEAAVDLRDADIALPGILAEARCYPLAE